MTNFLSFLSGKKSTIATLSMGTVAYLASKGIIGPEEVTLITVLVTALFGSASIATGKLVYGKR